MNSYGVGNLVDLDMKFLMSASYTSATALIIKACNEDLEDSSLSSAVAGTIHALNTLLSKQSKDELKYQNKEYIDTLKKSFLKIYKENIEMDEKAKIISYCLDALAYISKKLSFFGIELERDIGGTI